MRKVITICILLLLLSSCKMGGQSELIKANQEVILFTQLGGVYDYADVVNAVKQTDSLFDFCNILGVKYYKAMEEFQYTVLETTEGLVMILADSTGAYLTLQNVSFSSLNNKDALIQVREGMSLEDVRSADPDGQYDSFLHNSSNYPQFSYHFFEDGECYFIQYKQNHIIAINTFTI